MVLVEVEVVVESVAPQEVEVLVQVVLQLPVIVVHGTTVWGHCTEHALPIVLGLVHSVEEQPAP